MADQDGIPEELTESFQSFSSALDLVESTMKPLTEMPRNEMLKKFSPLDMAKLDLVSAYSINSLFWMYLITQGVNPRKHEIKSELLRIKSYMDKINTIEDQKNAPKIVKDAAKRFVRNAMFDLTSKKKEKHEIEEAKENPTTEQSNALVRDDIKTCPSNAPEKKQGTKRASSKKKNGRSKPHKKAKRSQNDG